MRLRLDERYTKNIITHMYVPFCGKNTIYHFHAEKNL